MRMKVEDFEVDDPQEAMRKFKSALAQIVKVPRIRRQQKRASAQPNKKRKS
jgi:hypothetical protein